MKIKISKIISLILSLNIPFIMCESVFAGKGDPLQMHKDYTSLIRKEFEWTEQDKQNSDYPVMCKIEPKFIFGFSDDYRTVRAYNIPHLVNNKTYEGSDNRNTGFFRTYAKAMMDAKKEMDEANRLEKLTKEVAAKYITEKITKICKDNSYDKEIAKFLGTDDKTAVNSFIASLIISSNSKCLGAIVGTSCLALNAFNFLQPIFLPTLVVAPGVGIAITVAHNLLNIARIATTSGSINTERVANYALGLSQINYLLLNEQNRVLDSNLLVTAVDERPFHASFIWNSYPGRRNDGAWGDFVKIGGLKCAPIARNYQNGKVLPEYLEIFQKITQDGNINFERIKMILNGQGTLSQSIQLQNTHTPIIEEIDEK